MGCFTVAGKQPTQCCEYYIKHLMSFKTVCICMCVSAERIRRVGSGMCAYACVCLLRGSGMGFTSTAAGGWAGRAPDGCSWLC